MRELQATTLTPDPCKPRCHPPPYGRACLRKEIQWLGDDDLTEARAREIGRRSVSISRRRSMASSFGWGWRSSQSTALAILNERDERRSTGKIAWAHLKELSDYYTRFAHGGGSGLRPRRAHAGRPAIPA